MTNKQILVRLYDMKREWRKEAWRWENWSKHKTEVERKKAKYFAAAYNDCVKRLDRLIKDLKTSMNAKPEDPPMETFLPQEVTKK